MVPKMMFWCNSAHECSKSKQCCIEVTVRSVDFMYKLAQLVLQVFGLSVLSELADHLIDVLRRIHRSIIVCCSVWTYSCLNIYTMGQLATGPNSWDHRPFDCPLNFFCICIGASTQGPQVDHSETCNAVMFSQVQGDKHVVLRCQYGSYAKTWGSSAQALHSFWS